MAADSGYYQFDEVPQEPRNSLEQILYDRAQTQNDSIYEVTMSYYGRLNSERLLSMPSLEVREALEHKWHSLGWVVEVTWDE